MSDITSQIDRVTEDNIVLNKILAGQNAIWSAIVTCVASVILFRIVVFNKSKEPFLILIPLLTSLSNVFQCIPTILVMDKIYEDPAKYNLANQLDYYYPVSILLSSFCAVLSHWIFAMKYLTTSLVLPKLFSYISVGLQEDKYTNELNYNARGTMTNNQMDVFREYMELAKQ